MRPRGGFSPAECTVSGRPGARGVAGRFEVGPDLPGSGVWTAGKGGAAWLASGMTVDHGLAVALRRRRYLLSAWPWRALAYAVTTLPLAGAAAFGAAVVAAPLLLVVSALRRGRPVDAGALAVLAVVALAVVAFAPLAGAPVAAVERWRLGLVDDRPVTAPRWRGLAARFTTATGWREGAYLAVLGVVVPLAYGMFGLLVLLDVALVAGPWLAGGEDRIVLVWATVDSPAEAVPYARRRSAGGPGAGLPGRAAGRGPGGGGPPAARRRARRRRRCAR